MTGTLFVLKSCDIPGSNGWLHLLNLAEQLEIARAIWWQHGKGHGLLGITKLVHEAHLIKLFLPYVPGSQLALDEFTKWLAPCAALLGRLHRLGFIHGDLKPENIVVTPDGELVLLDPGFSRRAPELSSVTARYAAPEVTGHTSDSVSACSDLFSLGAIWRESGPVEERFQPILDKLLAQETRNRYMDAGQFLQDLERGELGQWPSELLLTSSPWIPRPQPAAQLWQAAQSAAQGRATWVSVAGLSGMGKSRLLYEFSRSTGYRVLWGGCYPGESQLPLDALQESVDQLRVDDLGHDLEEETLLALQAAFPGLGRLGEVGSPSLGLVSPAQLAGCLIELFRAASSVFRPLLVVLDDLQWAQGQTRSLLGLLSQETRGHWLVCCSYRVDEWVAPKDWNWQAHVEIQPFNFEESALLASKLERSETLAKQAHEWAGGSPFFLLERYRQPEALSEDFSLSEKAMLWLRDRFLRLSTSARELLVAAALIGKRFELKDLDALEWSTVELERNLSLVSQERIIWVSGQRGVFCHDRLRELALHSSCDSQRKGLHLRLARALARKKPVDFPRIGHHLYHSDRPRRSLPYLIRGARASASHHHPTATLRLLTMALTLQDNFDWQVDCHQAESALGLFDEAAFRLRRLLDEHPGQSALLELYLAVLDFRRGRYTSAAQFLKSSLDRYGVPRSWLQLGIKGVAKWLGAPEAHKLPLDVVLPMVSQTEFQTALALRSKATYFYLFPPAWWSGEDPQSLLWLATLACLLYHFGPIRPAWVMANWVSGLLDASSHEGMRASSRARLTILFLGEVERDQAASILETSYRYFNRVGEHWEAAMSYLCLGFFWLSSGDIAKLASESETWLARKHREHPIVSQVAAHHFILSHAYLPETLPTDELDRSPAGQCQRFVVSVLMALRDGSFEAALANTPRPTVSLDEVVHLAWWVTLARAAAECLPRASAARRNLLLDTAEYLLGKCWRRSRRILLYHCHALRENALVLLLRGKPEDALQAFERALQEAIRSKIPYEELLIRRDWVRVGRLLDWPALAEHERHCVRLARQMGLGWLLPIRESLLPEIAELANQANLILRGSAGDACHDNLMAQTPEWNLFWASLRRQTEELRKQRQGFTEAVTSRSWLDDKLESLWDSETIALALVDHNDCVERESPAYASSVAQSHSLPWGKGSLRVGELQASPARQTLLHLQLAERKQAEIRLHPHLSADILGPEIESLLRRGLSLSGHLELPDLPTDAVRVAERVLRELLTNACKYAEPRQAEIVWRKEPSGWRLELANPVEGRREPRIGGIWDRGSPVSYATGGRDL